jgi:pimeloyl-ACP methyl ester carboxylesterase
MPYLTIDGLQVYYEDHGEGETMILLHHGFGCTKMFNNVYPGLVEAGYRVVLYDRRGYGRSEGGEDFQEFYVSDSFRPENVSYLAELKAQLDIGPCHLIGQCEGGVVASDFAARYPDEVKSLVTSSTQCFSEMRMEEFNPMKFPKPFREIDPVVQATFEDWHGKGQAEISYNMFRRFGGSYGRDYFDLRPTLREVTCPGLVIFPDRSHIFGVEQGVAFYRHLRQGELLVLPDCGHNTSEERPADYVRAILDFQRRVNSPSRKHRPHTT